MKLTDHRDRLGEHPDAEEIKDYVVRKIGNPSGIITTEESYVAPQDTDWPWWDGAGGCYRIEDRPENAESMLDLSKDEAEALAPLSIDCIHKKQYGKISKAPVPNMKKLSVVKAIWKDQVITENLLPTTKAKAAFRWLKENNWVYKRFVEVEHIEAIKNPPLYIPTAKLLLHMHGIECAARPLLYPTPAYLDTMPREIRFGTAMSEGQLLLLLLLSVLLMLLLLLL